MSKISFNNHGTSPGIKTPGELKKFLSFVMTAEGYDFRNISYIFCTDEYLHSLNKHYLSHDTLTDIITFTLSGVSMPIVSEIYISVERVKENAEKFRVSYLNELYRVMIHGILHLCGYSDHLAKLKAIMTEKEDFYLNLIDFT